MIKKRIWISAMLIFVIFQVRLSVLGMDIYPFNSYQMFSKPWHSGILIAGIEISQDGKSLSPTFPFVSAPFFQVNRIFLKSYYETSNQDLKRRFCLKLAKNSKGHQVEVYGVMKRFERSKNGGVSTSYDFKERVLECKI